MNKRKDVVNVFDFDGTLYTGESLIDCFFFYLGKGNFGWLKHLPSVIIGAIGYKLRLVSIDDILARTGKMAATVLKSAEKDDIHQVVADFWKKNAKKLKPNVLKLVKKEDFIITACPRLLLEGIIDQLPTKNFICSEVDMKVGKFTFLCAKEKKLRHFMKNTLILLSIIFTLIVGMINPG